MIGIRAWLNVKRLIPPGGQVLNRTVLARDKTKPAGSRESVGFFDKENKDVVGMA